MDDYLYECDYCHTKFKSEKRYMKHHCKEMQREEDFRSLNGQAALLFYKKWMKTKHRTSAVSIDAFKHSQYFYAFIRFVEFAKRTHLPDKDSYIELMVRQNIEPIYWTNDVAYAKYLEHITRVLSAERLIEITVQTIFDIADAGEVKVSEIFDILTPNDVIQLLQQRRISPWILLNSKKFMVFFRDKTNSEERVIMENLINPDYWSSRFQSNPEDWKLAKDSVAALEL